MSGQPPTGEQRVLDAAARLFVRQGYAATGIRQIADEAGLTIGAIYHHAGGKEALFTRVLERGYSTATAQATAVLAGAGTAVEKVVALIATQIDRDVADRDLWRLTRAELDSLSPAARAAVIEMRDNFEAVWHTAIAEGIAAGVFHPVDASIARLTIVGMCASVPDWFRPDGRLTLDEVAAVITDQVLDILRVDRPA